LEDAYMTWITYAFLSALFAGATALFAKLGVTEIPSNLATLVRTVVVVIFAAVIVLFQGQLKEIATLGTRDWTFLVLSGIATGLSWLFYFAALKLGPLSGVAPIDKLSFVVALALGVFILGEKVNGLTLSGSLLIVVGVLLTLTPIQERIQAVVGSSESSK